jgi:hypothetical protein
MAGGILTTGCRRGFSIAAIDVSPVLALLARGGHDFKARPD